MCNLHQASFIIPSTPSVSSNMEPLSSVSENLRTSRLLSLPAELRLQIYEYVLGSRTVHVRIKWTGICIPAGFVYVCLENNLPLLEPSESKTFGHAMPFGIEIHSLSHTCRQMHKETAHLPFKLYTWAFESAFTLDQWVSMKSLVPVQYKNAIRTVAVPTPGPHRSSERILQRLCEVLLIGSFDSFNIPAPSIVNPQAPSRVIITLRRDKVTDTWTHKDECAQYAMNLLG
jgi:hypothetical protein